MKMVVAFRKTKQHFTKSYDLKINGQLMVRDLSMILSWTGCAESYTYNANNSSIFFKKSMRNLKFC